MKGILTLTLLAWMATDLAARPYDPFDPDLNRPSMVRTQLEFVELDQSTYLQLMQQPRDSADATELRKRVVELVKRDEAAVLETMILISRSGERATVESVLEWIYPTEYEPPGFQPPRLTPEQLANLQRSAFAGLLNAPTSFETRNVGSTFEISTTIGVSNDVVDVLLRPEMVRFDGFNIHLERKDHEGNLYQDKHPTFAKRSFASAVTCRSGQYVLLNTLPAFATGDEGVGERKLMVFLKCDVLVVKESKE